MEQNSMRNDPERPVPLLSHSGKEKWNTLVRRLQKERSRNGFGGGTKGTDLHREFPFPKWNKRFKSTDPGLANSKLKTPAPRHGEIS